MTTILVGSSVVAALVHLLFFLEESVWWMKPAIHHKTFGLSTEDAKVVRLFAFNQGFYNLFLALEIPAGIALAHSGQVRAGHALVGFACASMLGAALVLVASSRRFWFGALVQGLPPAVALAALAARLWGG
jgi:putative membrane protein